MSRGNMERDRAVGNPSPPRGAACTALSRTNAGIGGHHADRSLRQSRSNHNEPGRRRLWNDLGWALVLGTRLVCRSQRFSSGLVVSGAVAQRGAVRVRPPVSALVRDNAVELQWGVVTPASRLGIAAAVATVGAFTAGAFTVVFVRSTRSFAAKRCASEIRSTSSAIASIDRASSS